jgi:hypothetical protein
MESKDPVRITILPFSIFPIVQPGSITKKQVISIDHPPTLSACINPARLDDSFLFQGNLTIGPWKNSTSFFPRGETLPVVGWQLF